METIDDDEAHQLAAKWLNAIKSNVGLKNDLVGEAGTSYMDVNRDSRKQVQQSYDVTDEKRNRFKEEYSVGKSTCIQFAKPNGSGESAEPCRNINNSQWHNNTFFKGLDARDSETRQILGGRSSIQNNMQVAASSNCDDIRSMISSKEKHPAKSVANDTCAWSAPDRANSHTDKGDKEEGAGRHECATSEELFEIWGFDEEQRKQAKHYLWDNAKEGSIMHGKENVPILDQNYQPNGVSDKGTQGRGRLESQKSTKLTKLNSQTVSFADITNVKDNYTVSGPNEKYHFEHLNQKAQTTQKSLVGCKEEFCKLCPGCSEVNLQNANWCEECGKALITVEATRKLNARQTNLLPSALPLDIEKHIVNSNKVLSSKLNPNSAEFVSAFAKPMQETPALDNNLPFRYDIVNGNERVYGGGWHNNARNSYMPDPVASCNFESSKVGSRNTWKVEQQHSASFTDGMKFSRKRDENNRRWKEDNQNERSHSFDTVTSACNQYFGSGSFEPAPKGYISSINPRCEQKFCYQSPSSNPESLGYNQASHSFDMQSQRPRSASWCSMPRTSPHGNLGQMSYSTLGNADTHRRSQHPFDDEFQRFDARAVYQGFDFQNPAFENPSLAQSNYFDEAQFSRDLVQSQLNNQIELLYGNWEVPPAHCIGSTGVWNPPPAAYPQHVSQDADLQSWRMYRKKKIVDNFIDSPRTPRSITRKGKHHAKSKMKEKQNGYSKVNAKPQDFVHGTEKRNPAETYQLEEPEVQLHPPVPPLALEDLDAYDQVLTLIRTAREEALPYLCLPEEIVLYVFSFLSTCDICKCSRVCRQFRRISMDESLWKEIIIRKRKDLNDEILAKIARKAPVSLTITQCHSNKVTEVGLQNFFRSCGENLQDVDFSSCSGKALVGELILLQLTSRCRKLRSLDISWSNVSDIGIQAFSENVEQLECLCMNGCQTITDETTRAIARKHTESVRVIEMFGCFNITHMSLEILQQFCPNIETLNVGQCHKITDVSVSEFARKTRQLENIDLRGCIQIKDAAIKDLACNCLNLSTLVIANCPLITDASMIAIAAHLPRIRCLDVCGCPKISERGIQALAKSCSRLEMIDLSSTKATDKAVSSLANYCYQTLESVKLSFCHSITETSLEQLAKKCNRLCLLHLYGCKRVKNLTRIQDCRRALKIES